MTARDYRWYPTPSSSSSSGSGCPLRSSRGSGGLVQPVVEVVPDVLPQLPRQLNVRLGPAKISTHHIGTLGGEGCGASRAGGCRGVCRAGLVVGRFGCIGGGDGGQFRCVIRDGGIIITRIVIILTPGRH